MSAHLKNPVSPQDHSQGPDSAPLTLVEYGDYQCPHCGRAFPIVKRLQKALGKDLKFVFRNFPLTQAHPDALNAAKVAEAAAKQGKFWEMHDALFENQDDLSVEALTNLSVKLKLNGEALEEALGDPGLEERLEKEIEGGVRSGVNGTPTFFLNGSRYDGDWSYGPFLGFLEEALKAAKARS